MTPPPGPVILVGPNGAGKTNLLEALRLLSVLRPWRCPDAGAVRSGPDGPAAGWRVAGAVEGGGARTIEVVFRRGPPPSKEVRLDGAPCARLIDAVGRLRTALFAPEDVRIVAGPPAERRRFVDSLVGQTDTAGLDALSEFRRIARNRARAWLDWRLGRAGPDSVRAWDAMIEAAAPRVTSARARAAERLAAAAARAGMLLMGGPLEVRYVPAPMPRAGADLRLAAGPGRDDLSILLAGRDLTRMASQGEARAASLALRLAEAAVVGDSGRPVALVDDVTGELDPRRRAAFLEAVASAGDHVIVAATEAGPFRAALPDAAVIRVPEDLRAA